jgi:predicted AAA+ superfamily ATPase
MGKIFISGEEKKIVRSLLSSTSTPRDALPYTDEFESLFNSFLRSSGRKVEKNQFWRMLSDIAKSGGGQKQKRKRVPSPKLSIEQKLEILRQFPEGIGGRDRLPYTPEFERLHRQYKKLTGLNLSENDYWLGVSSVAKKSRKPKPIFLDAPRGELPDRAVDLLEFCNPWWQGKTIPSPPIFRRKAFSDVTRLLQSKKIPVVGLRGPRRVGKTTIQQQLIEQQLFFEKIPPSHVLRVQFDEVPQLGVFDQPILSIIRWYEKNVLKNDINACAKKGENVYLYFDEVQDLPAWAEQIKSLVDHTECRLLITGSSSMRLRHGQENLAGRLSMLEMGPLNLREIASIRRLGELPPFPDADNRQKWKDIEFWKELSAFGKRHKKVIQDAFRHFSEWGGFPLCHTGGNLSRSTIVDMIAEAIITRTIEHDVPVNAQGQAWDKNLMRETFRHLCKFVGQIVKPEEIRINLRDVLQSGITNAKIYEVLDYLTETMLVHRIDPLEILLQKKRNGAKYCLCDHFIREVWLQEEVPLLPSKLIGANESLAALAGHVMESLLGYFLRSLSNLEISWFPPRKSEPEVDYIVTIGLQRIPIEVKYSRKKPSKIDISGLLSFCGLDKYNAPFGLLITQEYAEPLVHLGPNCKNIIAIPASTFLLLT